MTKEEAIEVYKGLINVKIKEAFEFFVPELRESEDERIRKRLVEYFNGFYDRFYSRNNVNVHWEGLEVKKVIAYLEKQKPTEVKPRFKIGDTLKRKNKDYTFVVDKIQGGFYLTSNEHFFPIEEQDSWELLEQNPAIKLVFPKFRVGDIIRNVHNEWDKKTKRISYVGEHGYYFDYRHLGDKVGGGSFGFCFEDYYELVEQKPAKWSEEDEKMIMTAIEACKTVAEDYENSNSRFLKCKAWLESLLSDLKKTDVNQQGATLKNGL